MSNRYHFITRWRVKGTAEEVFAILNQPVEYSRWWPSVYLAVRELAPGDRDGLGRRFRFATKGLLPFRWSWESLTTEVHSPQRIVLKITGDFAARGIWSVVPDGAFTDITFDWKLTAGPLGRRLSPLLGPVFEANHRWAMQQGEKSLKLEIARYRAGSVEEMNAIAAPAGPVEIWTRALPAGAVLAASLVAELVKMRNSHART